MRENLKKLKEYYPNWLLNGAVFTDLIKIGAPKINFKSYSEYTTDAEVEAGHPKLDRLGIIVEASGEKYLEFSGFDGQWVWCYQVQSSDVGKHFLINDNAKVYVTKEKKIAYKDDSNPDQGKVSVWYDFSQHIPEYEAAPIILKEHVGRYLFVFHGNGAYQYDTPCIYWLYDSKSSYLPWFNKDDTNQALMLDMQLYHLCADKPANNFIGDVKESYASNYRDTIALYLWRKYRYKWEREWETLLVNTSQSSLSFSPIENYDRKEEINSITSTTPTVDYKVTTKNKRNAFNSGSSVDTDSSEMSQSGGVQTVTTTKEGAEFTTHIHGNVGVTKAGDIISDALTIYEKNFYDRVCKDIMSELCMKIY